MKIPENDLYFQSSIVIAIYFFTNKIHKDTYSKIALIS